jgi:peptidoglycan biosynthesis protein MviN/MurJ (putative lipid II flippase)
MTLYALYLVLVVILGRTGRTEYNFPATVAATAVNIALNLVLIPPYGIVGAGIALVASYLVVLVLMYAFTQRLFPVPYEWGRLGLVLVTAAVLVAGGELLLPTEGAVGLIGRVLVWGAYPAVLWATGFATAEEGAAIRRLLDPRTMRERMRAMLEAPAEPATEAGLGGEGGRGPQLTEEVYVAEARDEDRGGA